MKSAIYSVFTNGLRFNGRAGREEFWYWCLFVAALLFVLALLEGALLAPALGFEAFSSEAGEPLRLLAVLLLLVPTTAVAVRRLHDINRSGWWLLIHFVPIIGILVLLWWFAKPGINDANIYGDSIV